MCLSDRKCKNMRPNIDLMNIFSNSVRDKETDNWLPTNRNHTPPNPTRFTHYSHTLWDTWGVLDKWYYSSTASSSISSTSNLLLTPPVTPPPFPVGTSEWELLRRWGLEVVICSSSRISSISSPSRPLDINYHTIQKRTSKIEDWQRRVTRVGLIPIAFSSTVLLGFVRRCANC